VTAQPAPTGAPRPRAGAHPSGPPAREARPPLRLVPTGAPPARRAPFVVLILGLLAGALVGLLLLNTARSQDSFTVSDLTKRGAVLSQREQEMQRAVEAAEAPGQLAQRARDLGMVPNANPLFIRLPDGAVLGAPSGSSTPHIATPASPDTTASAPASAAPADPAPATGPAEGAAGILAPTVGAPGTPASVP